MKFVEFEPFELEFKDDIFTGKLREPTKKEVKQLEKLSMRSKHKEIEAALRSHRKLTRLMELAAKVGDHEKEEKLQIELYSLDESIEKLNEQLEKVNPDMIFKKRLELTMESDFYSEIMELGELYGYEKVFNTILEDISERTRKN